MSSRTLFAALLSVLLIIVSASCEKAPETTPDQSSETSIGNPEVKSIVPAGAKMVKVTGDYVFDTSGSPLYVDGELYLTNNIFDPMENSRTLKMDKAGNISVLVEDNGVVTTIQHSGKGTFYACEMMGHRVVELGKDGKVIRVICGEYNGKRVDGPNDITVDRKGGFYFTESQFINNEPLMQDTPAVYYVKPDGDVIRVIDDVEFPNGIMLSPDEKTIYIADTRQIYLLAYDVAEDGTCSNRRNFAALQLSQANIDAGATVSGADGMAVDSAGNIYVATTQGLGIQVISPSAQHLGNIPCPTATNNVNFGGEDMKTLYISAKDGIYSIPVNIPGLRIPQM